jgi:uracil phosphoribosyltransferase
MNSHYSSSLPTNVRISNHPLVALKITELRDQTTPQASFRRRLQETSMLLAAEALLNLPLARIKVQTPLMETDGFSLKKPVAIVPILRAGLGMAESIASLLPEASVGHIGMFRDEKELTPQHYYFKMPPRLSESVVILVDPMVATGQSSAEAAAKIKAAGAREIHLIGLVGCPEGIHHFCGEHPDIQVTLGVLDAGLNEKGYILPGLGDAGDRYFGT